MEIENEVHVAWSPNARVVVGSPCGTVLGAAAIGFCLGIMAAMLVHRLRRRPRRRAGSSPAPPLRMPGEAPDVQTEL